ncbi:hypothetical protein A4X09_0g6877 [Tilletia walkeri]|uniref:Uncharacterized protein n=1 Tax=Tilletia walkeri TaxID=117179 RepID=A0A8X7N1U1_9BASI|nr:hypothetical protein A4X09_0g6877 [Tilletia walkeri]
MTKLETWRLRGRKSLPGSSSPGKWAYRKAKTNGDSAISDDFFSNLDIYQKSEVTGRSKAKVGLRWITLAHTLGDVAFLPILLLMGNDFCSVDRLRRMDEDSFGATVEFLQT